MGIFSSGGGGGDFRLLFSRIVISSHTRVQMGWDGSLDVLNNLDKSLESLQVTSLAQSKNGRQTNVLRLSLLNLLNKQWNKLASENLGLLGSEDTEDHGWEVVPHGGWVDVSMVEQVRELEQGGSVEHLVGLDS